MRQLGDCDVHARGGSSDVAYAACVGRRAHLAAAPIAALLLIVAFAVTALLAGCSAASTSKGSEYPAVGSEPVIAEPPVPVLWPYTGLEADDADAISRRPLSVKIENSREARPQTGLNQADVVYETIAEGGITRFNCIFQSNVPSRLGPVRSARLSDLWIVPQYDGLFFFSGANEQVIGSVKADGLDIMSHDTASALYARSSDRSAPHNLYLSTAKIYDLAKSKGYPVTATLEPLEFNDVEVVASAPNGTSLTLPMSNYITINWTWNSDLGVYERFHSNVAHVDSAGDQVRAKNVVIMWANYTPQSQFKGTYDIALGGSGKAAVFVGGQRIDGTWTAERNAPPKFKDASGNPILLNPGNTWFEVPPTDIQLTSN